MDKKRRGFIYLLEPVLVAIVVILLVAFFLPEANVEKKYRLVELHAQDIAAIVQKKLIVEENYGDIEQQVDELAKGINPEYEPCFRIYGRKEYVGECEGICVRRSWADENRSIKIEVCL